MKELLNKINEKVLNKEKILLLDELLDSSSSSSDEEIMATLMQHEMQIPKIRNMMDIINEYSDKEVCYIIRNFN